MSPAEFNAILARLFPDEPGKGQSALARWLELGDRSVRRYATGEQNVPPPLAKLLLYMDAAGLDPAAVDAAIAAKGKRRRR